MWSTSSAIPATGFLLQKSNSTFNSGLVINFQINLAPLIIQMELWGKLLACSSENCQCVSYNLIGVDRAVADQSVTYSLLVSLDETLIRLLIQPVDCKNILSWP